MDRKAIIEKLKSLQRLQDRAGSQGEAEAAAYAIAGIIDRYKLTVADLGEEEQEECKGKVKDLEVGEDYGRLPNYKRVLLNAITEHCGCEVIARYRDYRGKKYSCLIGYESDVEMASYLYSWLLSEISWLSPTGHGKAYVQSWCLGFAYGIQKQLRRAKKEVIAEAKKPECAAIVLSKDQAVDDFMDKMFPKRITTQVPVRISDRFAYLDGKLQGENTHLGKRMGGKEKKPTPEIER